MGGWWVGESCAEFKLNIDVWIREWVGGRWVWESCAGFKLDQGVGWGKVGGGRVAGGGGGILVQGSN